MSVKFKERTPWYKFFFRVAVYQMNVAKNMD